MCYDKIWTRHTILVGEDKVIGSCNPQSIVEYLRFTETVAFVLYVSEGKCFSRPFYQLTGFAARAVGGDNDFVSRLRLFHVFPQDLFQPFEMVICGDDHSNSKIFRNYPL